MRYVLLCLCMAGLPFILAAQNAAAIIHELKTINAAIAANPGSTGSGPLISNRAMNIFLSNKVGTNLSGDADLSLYKNSAVYSSADGYLAVNHNLYTPKGIDDAATSFMTVGLRVNIANAYASKFNGKECTNEFGFLLKQNWLGKVHTGFNGSATSSATVNQKQAMDTYRAAIVHTLETEINQKAAAFEAALDAIDTTIELPGQDAAAARRTARANFYTNLLEEYRYKFALQQSETLVQTNGFTVISTGWTTVRLYIPFMYKKFTVAPDLGTSFENRHNYPVELSVSHTRFWESTRAGRIFVTLGGGLVLNNAVNSQLLYTTNYADYTGMGGTDIAALINRKQADVYIGRYHNFVTPVLRAKLFYVPVDWHFGLTAEAEQNFGSYNTFNTKLGVPIVLIDKKGDPAINFEFQIRFFDVTNTLLPNKKSADKTSVGVTIGIPFSKIIY